jgi:Aspartate-semialdehyde dehydrogenase
MTKETKKIMEDDSIAVSATCVRIPVLSAHSESVYIETKEVAQIDEVKAAIAAFPGAVLEDDVAHQIYPQAVNAVGSVIPLLVVSVKTWMQKKEFTCGLFQITFSKVLLGTQFRLLKLS